ncbi:GLPGLI family protein [Halpernia frigidisoli]|uniref:GLPGLI family protein n=1 Tax=Halpernia frigidisoli TaxID=1125876 RepID=A0A1I3HN29_9FLAO|nr:GLPGLI family protein [Halpernia frigidisoli]SFI37091.1 GLPGLI family protein [Halpernia frigidisoli]
MKKYLSIALLAATIVLNAQVTANRFFYELTFKPKQDSTKVEKVMTILDITKDKSLYRDYTLVAQDSIMKIAVEEMQKSGAFKDLSKTITMPKFGYKVEKEYPAMKETYSDRISSGFTPMQIAYTEEPKFNWKISNDKEKIGDYNTQKATTEYGGRQWTAWFSTDLPFQDGPYKFAGLPGLIVKVEDSAKNYSWLLRGNKKVENFQELSYAETITPGGAGKLTVIPRDKFEKTLAEYKKDPFATMRPMLTKEMMDRKMPGMDGTIGDMLKKQEKMTRDFYDANNNPIEMYSPSKK